MREGVCVGLVDRWTDLFTCGGSKDAANGVSFFPDACSAQVAVTSGQRHYALPSDMEDEADGTDGDAARNNVLRIYSYKKTSASSSLHIDNDGDDSNSTREPATASLPLPLPHP